MDTKPGFSTLDRYAEYEFTSIFLSFHICSKPNYGLSTDNAIVFTKPKSVATRATSLVFSEAGGVLTAARETPAPKNKGKRLFLSKDSVLNIQKNKADYESYLRRTTQAAQGKFKPAKVMEEYVLFIDLNYLLLLIFAGLRRRFSMTVWPMWRLSSTKLTAILLITCMAGNFHLFLLALEFPHRDHSLKFCFLGFSMTFCWSDFFFGSMYAYYVIIVYGEG
jgi:hypothetical protein